MREQFHCEVKWKIEDYNNPSAWTVIETHTLKHAAEAFAEQLWFERPNKDLTVMLGHWAIGVKPVKGTKWTFFDVKVKVQTSFRATERREYVLNPPAIQTHA